MAATALVRDLTVMSRDEDGLRNADVAVVNHLTRGSSFDLSLAKAFGLGKLEAKTDFHRLGR